MKSIVRIRSASRTRRLIYALLLLVLAASGILLGLICYKPSPIQVAVAGSSLDLGSSYGRKLRIPIGLVTRFYLDRIVCLGDSKLIQGSRAAALRNLANWPKPYHDELNAAAEAAGAPVSALAFGNSFLDLGKARVGCRSVVLVQSNLVLHAHNLDWDNLGGFGRWTTCLIRRAPSDGRLATVSIGFPGLIGALDIINERGLALSFNQLGWGKGGTNEPVFVMLRRIAETCDSMNAARNNLLSAPAGMPFIITVSDSKAGLGRVFEHAGDRVTERPLHDGFVAACNAAQGTSFGATRLDQLLTSNPPNDLNSIRSVLSNSAVMMDCNIYSVVFDFQHNRFWLASGEVPAARGVYREYPLFR